MINRSRFFALLVVLVLIIGTKLTQELVAFYGSREERVAISRLEGRIRDVGRAVIETQVRAESLRSEVLAMDRTIEETRDELVAVEARLLGGAVTPAAESSYLRQLDAHNQLVIDRNGVYREWRLFADSHVVEVGRYNAIVDSIRSLARIIGEPYYPVATPAEIAEEQRDEFNRR